MWCTAADWLRFYIPMYEAVCAAAVDSKSLPRLNLNLGAGGDTFS